MLHRLFWIALATVLAAGCSITVYTFKNRPEGFRNWWNGDRIAIFMLLWLLFMALFLKAMT
jgi:hypothetical protein